MFGYSSWRYFVVFWNFTVLFWLQKFPYLRNAHVLSHQTFIPLGLSFLKACSRSTFQNKWIAVTQLAFGPKFKKSSGLSFTGPRLFPPLVFFLCEFDERCWERGYHMWQITVAFLTYNEFCNLSFSFLFKA